MRDIIVICGIYVAAGERCFVGDKIICPQVTVFTSFERPALVSDTYDMLLFMVKKRRGVDHGIPFPYRRRSFKA